MPRTLQLLAVLTLFLRAGYATIIIAVGTGDGLLVCEDRRLTATSANGSVSYSDAAKAQQLGKFGFFAVTGDVSASVSNVFGRSVTAFDILSGIPDFFRSRDIQQFNPSMAREFEDFLRDQLNRKPSNPAQPKTGPRALTEVLLHWMDESGHMRFYVLDITDGLRNPNPSAPLLGQFYAINTFGTSKPIVRGRGLLGYTAIASGTNPAFDDLRQDDELKPFLSNFVSASSIDSIAATRSLRKLIRVIAERQNLVSPDGLDVGPDSDCFLGTNDGIKYINQ